jgi:hypothetical protein
LISINGTSAQIVISADVEYTAGTRTPNSLVAAALRDRGGGDDDQGGHIHPRFNINQI